MAPNIKFASVTSTGALPASISVLSEMRSDDEVEAIEGRERGRSSKGAMSCVPFYLYLYFFLEKNYAQMDGVGCLGLGGLGV